MKKILITLLALAFFVGCKQDKKETETTTENTKTEPLKVFMFDGGTIQVNTLEIFSQGDLYKGESKTFANMFFVVQHPKGNLIWDAGLGENLIGKEPFTTPNGAFTVSRSKGIDEQLKQIGLAPKDFKYIALSHTHFDHSGSANKFANATWLVQQKEFDFVTVEEENTDNHNAIKALKKVKKLNGDFDVFGDGKVVIKFMPGHTIGHQVLFLDLEQEGPLLLSGDLYHFEENKTGGIVPSFNFSVKETKASMDAFEEFAEQKNARVIIQHSLKHYNNLNHAPEPIQ